MDRKELLKSMLQDVINDRQEQASVTLHDYFVGKMRDVTGLGGAAEQPTAEEAVVEEGMHDKVVYHHPGGKKATDFGDLNGAEVDPDDNTVTVGNRTSLTDTHKALEKAGWKKKQVVKGKVGGIGANDSEYK